MPFFRQNPILWGIDFDSWLSANNTLPKSNFARQIEIRPDKQFFERLLTFRDQILNSRQLD
jgi:hypothetical protein